MNFDSLIRARKSSRKFNAKRPKWQSIIEAVSAATHVPLAGNLCNFKYIIVDDQKLIDKIAKACHQEFVGEAHFVVVVTNRPGQLASSYDNGEKYASEQIGASIQTFLLKLTELGLSSCWVGAFVEDQIKTPLKIPEGVKIEAIIPIGYDADKMKRKPKPILDAVLRFNNYEEKSMIPKKKVTHYE